MGANTYIGNAPNYMVKAISDENGVNMPSFFGYILWSLDMYRYHGLNREDAVFFNMSDLICNLARTEDCIIVGRCADIILRNNYIPHISLFISAPFEVRLHYMMNVSEMDQKTAVKFLKKWIASIKNITNFIQVKNGELLRIMTCALTVPTTESKRR